jgi:hypothetical protein
MLMSYKNTSKCIACQLAVLVEQKSEKIDDIGYTKQISCVANYLVVINMYVYKQNYYIAVYNAVIHI